MKKIAAFVLLLVCVSYCSHGQEPEEPREVPPELFQKMLNATLKEEGNWGLLQRSSRSNKMELWAYVTESRIKLHSFDLDFPPAAIFPDSEKDDFDVKEHAKYFKDGQKFPDRKLTLFKVEQAHVQSIVYNEGTQIRHYCVHFQVAAIDMKTGEVVAVNSDTLGRIVVLKPKDQKKEEPKKTC